MRISNRGDECRHWHLRDEEVSYRNPKSRTGAEKSGRFEGHWSSNLESALSEVMKIPPSEINEVETIVDLEVRRPFLTRQEGSDPKYSG